MMPCSTSRFLTLTSQSRTVFGNSRLSLTFRVWSTAIIMMSALAGVRESNRLRNRLQASHPLPLVTLLTTVMASPVTNAAKAA